ncbi:MAG: hypothetical protein JST46_02910 [Bacteroidetes bacterium]|nr:hypothetical protein [Bacteroidota bacterium]
MKTKIILLLILCAIAASFGATRVSKHKLAVVQHQNSTGDYNSPIGGIGSEEH